MSISASCPSCGNKFEFTDDYAGRMLLCRQCKNTFAVPVPGGEALEDLPQPPGPVFPAMVSRAPSMGFQLGEDDGSPRITHAHESAGRVCGILAVLYVLSSLAIGGMALLFSCLVVPAKFQPVLNNLVVIMGWVAGAVFVVAMVYMICGGAIKSGGLISAWFMLLLTVVQLFGSICGLGGQVMRITSAGGVPTGPAVPGSPVPVAAVFWTSLVIGVIMLLLHAKLFLCLVSIVCRRRPRPARGVQMRGAWA